MPIVHRVVRCPAFPDMRYTEYAFVSTDCTKCPFFGGDPAAEMLADLRHVAMTDTDRQRTLLAIIKSQNYVLCSLEAAQEVEKHVQQARDSIPR